MNPLCTRCEKRRTPNGLCYLCRHALKRNPDAKRRPWQDGKKGLSVKERFLSHIEEVDGCWLWTARLDADGYGQFRLDGITRRATRVAYELFKGPIPEDAVLDHTCHTPECSAKPAKDRDELLTQDPYGWRCPHRRCVNPDHLEPVTNQENILRGVGLPAVNWRKTRCKNGHEYTPENTIFQKGGRMCLICRNRQMMKNFPYLIDRYPEVATHYMEEAP